MESRVSKASVVVRVATPDSVARGPTSLGPDDARAPNIILWPALIPVNYYQCK